MNLFQVIRSLQTIALTSPYINSAGDGSIYDFINANPSTKYAVFFVSQTTHKEDRVSDYYGLNLFVIDRLIDDLESNRLQIQSIAKDVLSNTIKTFVNTFYGVSHENLVFTPFTEKFVDLCAGVYCSVTFKVPKTVVCSEEYNYTLPLPPGTEVNNQEKSITIINNQKVVVTYDNGYTGLEKVDITVNVPVQDWYDSGYTEGVAHQKSLLSSLDIVENGEYVSDNGYSAITVNVPQSGHTDEEMQQAYLSGATYQKSLMVPTAVTANGIYTRADGFSSIHVSVPQSGSTIKNQNKVILMTDNGSTAVTYDAGYTGLGRVDVRVDVPQTGYTPADLDRAWNMGFSSGRTYQESKIIGTGFTVNGTYYRQEGWSAVTVSVPRVVINNQYKNVTISGNGVTEITYDTGYTGLEKVRLDINVPSGASQEELQQAFESGYTNGRNEGYAVGYEAGYASGSTDGYALGFDMGFNSGYTNGKTEGYESGYTIGYNAGYEAGYDSGYTSGLTVGYESGYTIGYNTGYTIGYNAGYNAGDYILSIDIMGQPSATSSALTGNATVTLTYGGSAFTQTYNGDTLEFNIKPGLDYSVSYGYVTDFESPSSFTGISMWQGTRHVDAEYTYAGITPYGKYFTISVISAGTIVLSANTSTPKQVMYSLNDGAWISSQFLNTTINVSQGDELRLKADTNTFSSQGNLYYIHGTASFNVYGNIMSLLYGDDYMGKDTISNDYTFNSLFTNYYVGANVIDASDLILPAATLANRCYEYMFRGCRSLVNAPKTLPATTLASRCYYEMFYNCWSLVTPPVLPATTLVSSCYYGMFNNCSGLTSAPALPSTTLAQYCYQEMFRGCISLTSAPALPATTLANSCYNNMFRGCTSLTSAPALPATTLADSCYRSMFEGCSSLNYIECLATDISASECTYYWVEGVSSSGTFIKDPNMTGWSTGSNGIPDGWTVVNAS